MDNTVIPTAAEIVRREDELKQMKETVKSGAIAKIEELLQSLAVIGEHYKLVQSDGPVKPPKPRKSPTCSICHSESHRAPQHDKVVLQKAGDKFVGTEDTAA